MNCRSHVNGVGLMPGQSEPGGGFWSDLFTGATQTGTGPDSVGGKLGDIAEPFVKWGMNQIPGTQPNVPGGVPNQPIMTATQTPAQQAAKASVVPLVVGLGVLGFLLWKA